MLLEVKNLAVSYDGRPTIENVNFNLNAGEILAIVGESGSGKTTVIRSLMGCLPNDGQITAGECLFDGQNLCDFSDRDWRAVSGEKISMIFQDCGNMLNPIRTIGSQFIEFIKVHTDLDKAAAHAKALDMLTRMSLPNPENIMTSYPFELSGGMRQRVGIAMGITFHPKLLLADEPTSALDVTTQAQIVMQLTQIAKTSGTAMIIVTHNIGVAAYMADYIMVMLGGQVVEQAASGEVIARPQHDYTKELLAAVPQIGGKRYAV